MAIVSQGTTTICEGTKEADRYSQIIYREAYRNEKGAAQARRASTYHVELDGLSSGSAGVQFQLAKHRPNRLAVSLPPGCRGQKGQNRRTGEKQERERTGPQAAAAVDKSGARSCAARKRSGEEGGHGSIPAGSWGRRSSWRRRRKGTEERRSWPK